MMDTKYVIYELKCGPYYYVGSTKNSRKRKSDHLRLLKSNTHYNKKLQNVYNKYIEYHYTIIYKCVDQVDMEVAEVNFIKQYKTIHKNYCANILDEYGGGSAWRKYKTVEELKLHDGKRLNLNPEQKERRNKNHKNTLKNTPQHIKDERMARKIKSCNANIKNRKNYTPFKVTFKIPNVPYYFIEFNSESEFFETTKLEETSLRELKTTGIKTIKRRLHWTKHTYPVGTQLILSQGSLI